MIEPGHVFSLSIEPAPEPIAVAPGDGRARGFVAYWTVPSSVKDLPYLDGHFPQNPIFPAVGIVDATLQCLRQGLGDGSLQLRRVDSAKFLGVIRPGASLRIELTEVACGTWTALWSLCDETKTKLADLRLRL
jgi:hypothetical protein